MDEALPLDWIRVYYQRMAPLLNYVRTLHWWPWITQITVAFS